MKLKKNLHIFNQNQWMYLRALKPIKTEELLASPRV
jgi:hypothetical protein